MRKPRQPQQGCADAKIAHTVYLYMGPPKQNVDTVQAVKSADAAVRTADTLWMARWALFDRTGK